jgi:hypothetical protein
MTDTMAIVYTDLRTRRGGIERDAGDKRQRTGT